MRDMGEPKLKIVAMPSDTNPQVIFLVDGYFHKLI